MVPVQPKWAYGPWGLACERDVTLDHQKLALATQPPPDHLQAQRPDSWMEGVSSSPRCVGASEMTPLSSEQSGECGI